MKKAISVFLAVLMALSCLAVGVSAADDRLSLTVVTDVHHCVADNSAPVTKSTPDNPFGYVVSNGKMTMESAAIVDEFLKQAAANDSEYLVITGDISDNGQEAEARAIVAKLEAFEQASGKSVIAVIGNHETYGMTYAQFKDYYKNLGYDKALAVDPASASYTVDLSGNYRLIAIDVNGFSQKRIDWIDQQVAAAKADGKKLISVTHFNIFEHYSIQQIAHDSIIDPSFGLADKFIDWGIKYNFTGHTHELDIASYSNDKGVVYDIVGGSLTTYPANYRTAVFTDDKVVIDTKYIEKIDTSLIPEGLCEEAASLLASDFPAYAKRLFTEGSFVQLETFATVGYVANLAKLNKADDPEIYALLEKIIPRLKEAIEMPLYGENGLEKIALENRFPIAKSDYENLLSVGVEMYAQHCAGNENCTVYTGLGKVAVNAFGAALAYALEPLTVADLKMVLTWAVNTFDLPLDLSENLLNVAANLIDKTQAIEFIVAYAVTPFLDDFAKDPAPADVYIELPGYGFNEVGTVSFFAKVREFFRGLLLFLNTLFSFVKRPKF